MALKSTRWQPCTLSLVLALALWGVPASAAEPEQACADCHGKDGASQHPDVPIIGGQSEQYLLDSMAAYREKSRPCPESKYRAGDKSRAPTTMCKIASALSEADTAAVAKHLSSEPFVRAKQQADAQKAALGKKLHDLHCEKCHADGGSSPDDDSGILAGQWMEYLRHSMGEFTSGTRPMPEKMKPKVEKLGPADIEALIHYYGSQN